MTNKEMASLAAELKKLWGRSGEDCGIPGGASIGSSQERTEAPNPHPGRGPEGGGG